MNPLGHLNPPEGDAGRQEGISSGGVKRLDLYAGDSVTNGLKRDKTRQDNSPKATTTSKAGK